MRRRKSDGDDGEEISANVMKLAYTEKWLA